MITVVSGDLEKAKAEMKQKAQGYKNAEKALRKLHKKDKLIPAHVQTKLDNLVRLQKIYSASWVVPVKVGGIIINYKVLQAYLKKLKKFNLKIAVSDDRLTLTYKQDQKGYIELYDMSKYFHDFKHIPSAVIDDGSKA
ncbi:hypothetical protein B5V89_18675 [Heyndrickxia sporothermodurans]|uniref:hypothetical protein n=1 Tax=Heyndrickxia sporothermodurans TaxID=46224 RepID=UPI000D3AFE0B|nr:hypothetical protein [Heyndrickxia sporothermodurans]PTY76237.1 hypothetical protein B5V89_18675 [Heyndrickxia sporothermodurans]